MRTLLIAALLLSIPTSLSAQAFNFAGVEWGSSPEATVKALSSSGFKNIQKDKDGDYTFEGDLVGFKVKGVALMAREIGIVKFIVRLVTPDRKARDTYVKMKETLSEKYGDPKSYEYFTKPYYEGDGYEDQAIRLGKGRFVSFWTDELTGAGLMLEISEQLTVDLSYESPFWSQEADRRKKAATSVF